MFVKSEELDYADSLLERFRTPAIMLHRPYPPIGFSSKRSKLGGLPNLPDDIEWPIGKDGSGNPVHLHFLAQIDCAQLPEIDADMPVSGMIFFFGYDDAEQVWCDYPKDSVRAIYCEIVALDQGVRTPPPNLLPIGCGYYNAPPWQLPGELRSNVHTSWPLVPLKIDSWPDASAILGVVIDSDHNENQSKSGITEMSLGALFRRTAPTKAGRDSQKVEFSKETSLLYARRLQAMQVAAILAATELPTISKFEPVCGTMTLDSEVNHPFGIPYPETFPQMGLMVDRIARMVVRKCISYKEHHSYQSEGYIKYLNLVEESGRLWIEKAKSIGLENKPSDEERSHLIEWICDLRRPDEFHVIRGDMKDIFIKALLSCIEYASDKPELMSRFPEIIWEHFENFHLPISQRGGGGKWRIKPFFHQMLGHARTCQELDSIEDAPVLLLQLQTDYGINMKFGDVGSSYFWIKREDLKLRRFDRVWGDVVGH